VSPVSTFATDACSPKAVDATSIIPMHQIHDWKRLTIHLLQILTGLIARP
jgi:hypothetical protein